VKEWSMTDDATAGISEVGAMFVPVSDTDRSLEFSGVDAEIARGHATIGARVDCRARRRSGSAAVLRRRSRRKPLPDRPAGVTIRGEVGHNNQGGSRWD
jgi:hypothetical protein